MRLHRSFRVVVLGNACSLLLVFGLLGSAVDSVSLFREDFVDLNNWQAWGFEKVDRPTDYEIRELGGRSVLRMEADRSASGLILRQSFPAREGIRLRWRWRADIQPQVTDPLRREGDDYPLRVYVIFERNASEATWWERWALRNAPFRDEGVLPERSLVYVWTDRHDLPEDFPNPYTKRVQVIPTRSSDGLLGSWSEAEIAPVVDYRRIFDRVPPDRFRLALMSDADDTQSRALAWMDFLEVEHAAEGQSR